jgi:LuxR family maltose regulon positive regulatory protein
MLLNQRLDEAAHWAQDYQQSAPVEFMRDYEDLTLARVWLAQEKSDVVLPHLDPLIGAARAAGRAGTVLEAQLLQALAFQADGQHEDALAALENALRPAAVEGYVRLFLDEGPPMIRLLQNAVDHNVVSDYAGRLLREAENESRRTHPADVLTDRELEVLELVAQGATNQDVADTLVISLGTVKSHVNHIMSKLDAQNRTEAVAKAQSLGILDA